MVTMSSFCTITFIRCPKSCRQRPWPSVREREKVKLRDLHWKGLKTWRKDRSLPSIPFTQWPAWQLDHQWEATAVLLWKQNQYMFTNTHQTHRQPYSSVIICMCPAQTFIHRRNALETIHNQRSTLSHTHTICHRRCFSHSGNTAYT